MTYAEYRLIKEHLTDYSEAKTLNLNMNQATGKTKKIKQGMQFNDWLFIFCPSYQ